MILSAVGSFFLKIGTSTSTENLNFFSLVGNQTIWIGAIFYAAAFLGYVYVLRLVPLSLAQPILTAGVSAVTALFAVIVLRETMATVNWIGLALICLGVSFLFCGRT